MGVPLGGNRSFTFFYWWACGVAARYNLAAFLPVDCGKCILVLKIIHLEIFRSKCGRGQYQRSLGSRDQECQR